MKTIILIPFELKEKNLLGYLKKEIETRFESRVIIHSSTLLPLCRKRENQSHAEDFLPIVRKICMEHKAFYGLGVMDGDLYIDEMNFVLGFSFMTSSIIGLARLRDKDKHLFFERAAKESFHELGHLFGLKHCKDKNCVMYLSSSIEETDKKGSEFCIKCKECSVLKN